MTYIQNVTSKGQVTIPLSIREMLGIKPLDKVAFVKENEKVIIKPVSDFMSLKGSIKAKEKFSDEEIDKKVLEFVGKKYEK